MRILLFITFFQLWFPQGAQGFKLDLNKWNDFTGMLGNSEALISIFALPNNELKGNYCYKKYDTRITLKGKISGDVIELTEYVAGQPNGTFTGKLFTNDADRFEGTWTDKTGTKKLDFGFTLSAITTGTFAKRYENMIGSDAAVEGFVKRFKTTLNRGNKEWVADHIQYPIKTKDVSGKPVMIKSRAQMLKEFDKIFYPAFIEQIKHLCACNMFSNYEGVMLGNGQLWFANSPESTDKKFDFVIITINN